MGIFIDYAFVAECSEAELLKRLKRLRKRIVKFDLERVDEIQRLEPVYNSLLFRHQSENYIHVPDGTSTRGRKKRADS